MPVVAAPPGVGLEDEDPARLRDAESAEVVAQAAAGPVAVETAESRGAAGVDAETASVSRTRADHDSTGPSKRLAKR